MRKWKEEPQHSLHARFLSWGRRERGGRKNTSLQQIGAVSWGDISGTCAACGKKHIMPGWNPPFVPARQIPEFNWITTNPIEPRDTSHPCIPECAEKAAVLLLFQSLGLFPPSSKSPKWGEKHGMRAQKPKQKPACGGVDRVSCDWEHLCFPPCDFIYFILLQPQIHSVGRYGSRHRALPKPAARSRPRRFQPGESRGKKWGWAAAANQSNFPSSAPRSEMEKPML